MMALRESSQYGLLSRDSVTDSNLSCVHVKLTDAALKVIEDIKLANKSGRPTIEINDENGVIRIPDGRGYKEFFFSVGPLPSDPNGSYDCIKLAKNGKLETLDTMTQKISVKATDEVYQTTRDKLAVKNEESKKNGAKEIDQTRGGVKSKRITKTIRNGSNSALRPSATQSNIKQAKSDWPSPSTSSPATISPNPNSLTPGGSSTSPPLAPSTMTTPQANNNYSNASTMANSQTNAAKMLDKLKRKQQSKLNTAAKEAAVAHNKTSGPSKSEREKLKAALLAVPLRERIVHALGLKPNMYNTPQFLLKLRTEGLSSASNEHSTASEVTRILGTVGAPNSKGCWALRPEHLAEVDVNWGFYSETDKQLVKRNLNRAGSVRPVVAVHPTSDTTKRKKEVDDSEDLPLSKREKFCRDPSTREDFVKKYTIITNSDQRNRYKEDFNSEYQEYKLLFDYVERINEKFRKLASDLSGTVHGSDQYKKIERRIKKKYNEVKRSKEYLANKPRLEYLHCKLEHIKRIVHDYDTSTLD